MWIFPIRILLEMITLVYAVLKLDFRRFIGVFRSFIYIVFNIFKIISKRVPSQRVRKVPDSEIFAKLYRGSLVFDYFIRGVRRFQDLKFSSG
jgi:hypothetical protein